MQAQEDSDASLDELMAAYGRGDDRRFEALYDGLSARLETYLRRRGVREQWRLDDLVQQTFMQIHAARGHFVPGAPVLPWACRIAWNAMIDGSRKARREQTEDLADEENVHHARLPTPPSPEQLVQAQQLTSRLETVYGEAPEPQRAAFELVKAQGLSAQQAATTLGTTATGVRLRLHRFYQAVRQAFRDDPDVPEAARIDGDVS
jgi:RNA polymerase sigma-70 factor (ECF subfamily)